MLNWKQLIFPVALCPTISLGNGEVHYQPSEVDGGYPTGTVAFFSCDEGYITNGSVFVTCQDSGTWDSEISTCREGFKPKDY